MEVKGPSLSVVVLVGSNSNEGDTGKAVVRRSLKKD